MLNVTKCPWIVDLLLPMRYRPTQVSDRQIRCNVTEYRFVLEEWIRVPVPRLTKKLNRTGGTMPASALAVTVGMWAMARAVLTVPEASVAVI